MRISVFGLGKLGTPLAAVMAEGGSEVIGVDPNDKTIDYINGRKSPVQEPDVQEILDKLPDGQLTATSDYKSAVDQTDSTFIIVPTPSNQSGGFSNSYVLDAVRQIGEGIAEKDTWHLVVVCSTVMPGSLMGEIADELANASGKRIHEDYGLAYNPEFIALGDVVKGLKHPDMVLIGSDDARTGQHVAKIARTFVDEPVPFSILNAVNAEIAKITLNSFVTMKISFANQLAEACELIDGADASKVLDAVGADSRIGKKYLTPGVSYGGPCFPRDCRAFAEFVPISPLASATDSINDHQVKRMVDIIRTLHVTPGKQVGVIGVSYKPGTPVYEESFGYRVIKELGRCAIPVTYFDKLMPNVDLGQSVTRARNHRSLFEVSDVLVLAHPEEELTEHFPKVFENRPHLKVIDCWNVVPDMGPWEINFYRVGKGRF